MKRVILPIILGVIFASFVLLSIRFFIGGDEDNWICINNQWIKHGNPKASMPQTGCGIVKEDWKMQTIDEAGITLKYPPGTTYRKEVASDSAGIHAIGFYVEKGNINDPSYTLYGIYQPNKKANEKDLELAKTGMDPKTIKEVTIAGFKGIEGLITGPKTRFMTAILKDNYLLTISTIPPTPENKTLTDKILATFNFK